MLTRPRLIFNKNDEMHTMNGVTLAAGTLPKDADFVHALLVACIRVSCADVAAEYGKLLPSECIQLWMDCVSIMNGG